MDTPAGFIVDRLLNLLFPSACSLCGGHTDSHMHNPLCRQCWAAMTRYDGPSCRVCGVPTVSPHTARCAACTETPPPFSKILCHGLYEGALKEAVHLLKFGGFKRLARPLSELLAALPLPEADAIVPVPLHRNRLLEREFNQTAVLGRHLSRKVELPLRLTALRKHRETRRQTEVTGRERLKNLRKAFTADGSFKDARILLLDDVITTTATVRECAQTLREAGAREVTVVALARSRPRW